MAVWFELWKLCELVDFDTFIPIVCWAVERATQSNATTDRFVFRVISIRLHFCMDHKLEMSENGMKQKIEIKKKWAKVTE